MAELKGNIDIDLTVNNLNYRPRKAAQYFQGPWLMEKCIAYTDDLTSYDGCGEQKQHVKISMNDHDKIKNWNLNEIKVNRKGSPNIPTREELTNNILRHYRKKNEEEYGMTGSEFKKFENDIRMINGNIVIEGLAANDCTAHIEVPFEYLKYIKVAMPTTDFCISKRTDTKNWIDGLPAIKRIDTYNDRVVKVTFIDDTFTKSVCSENDHFDLDVGITICCMKRMMGKDGNKHYNNVIRMAHKVIVENDKKKARETKEEAERKLKMRKEKLKKAAGRLKAKEEQIETQAQAIVKAHHMLEDERKNG